MTIFGCRGCGAKDNEIARLSGMLSDMRASSILQADKLLQMARDAAGLTPQDRPPEPPADPLPDELQDFLDAKFKRNSPLWRQQSREARRLVDDGKPPKEIVVMLARGQAVEL